MNTKMRHTLIAWALIGPIAVVILFPFAVMLITALKPADEVLQPHWWPRNPQWGNFIAMWKATNFGPALLNSLLVSGFSTALAVAVSVPAAYALARMPFRGKGAFRQFLLISQMLSPIVLVLGLFQLVASLGLLDSKLSIVLVYAAFAIAFATWLLQSYFSTIPRDLEEAAWIEGASRTTAIRTVFLPLALPAIAVTCIFTFVQAWNEFVLALTLLRSQESYTLPIQIFSLVAGRYTIEWNYVMAAALVATVPVAIVFAIMQRHLVRGLASGAVK
ncbi:carbohydrate ABC transporter permease [Pseudoruegeria sp. SK021]|uniref:carbohydrate ABC transporter permease n=1 Tax=Pseudoruegeria sp. SK021 TaxID=1933035 RepID=UPI000A32A868|nr:carbohydrate ABC transporter permease [Pseudoruegeria sp. SK021]